MLGTGKIRNLASQNGSTVFGVFCCLIFLTVMLVSASAYAGVTVYRDWLCSGDYQKTFNHGGSVNLQTVYYDGTTTPVNQSIRSIFIEGGWEVLACDGTNYTSCAAQLNTEEHIDSAGNPFYQGTCINLFGTQWSSTYPIPPMDDITSISVQPKGFEDYWEWYDFRENYSESGDRFGYIELFSGTNYTGNHYKLYASDYDLAGTPIGYAAQSIRLHGELLARICNNPNDGCFSNTLVYQDIPDIQGTVYGIQSLYSNYSSALVCGSGDSPSQAEDFLEAFLSKSNGPNLRRDSYFRWAQSGAATTHVATWPSSQCYSDCTEGFGQWECSDDFSCCAACKKNQHEYLGRLNRTRWAGDSTLVFIGAHGGFRNEYPVADSEIWTIDLDSWMDNDHTSWFFSRAEYSPHDDISMWDWSSNTPWGDANTDWILTTACESLGSDDMPLVINGSSLNPNYPVGHAWGRFLLSGVHGIGGYYGSSWWRSLPSIDRTGDDIASDFWSDLVTKSVADSWGGTKEHFYTCPNRIPYFMQACPPSDTISECISRMDSDFYPGYMTGSLPDLEGYSDLRYHIEYYEP